MRIGIDARAIGTYPGIGTYGDQLIRALAKIDRENEYIIFKNSVYTFPPEIGSNFMAIDVDIPVLSIASLFRFGSIVAAKNLDVLHSICEILPLGGDYKKIINVHDLINLAYPWAFKHQNRIKDLTLRLYFRTIARYGIRNVSGIIAISNYTKHDLINWLEIDDEKIFVTYLAAGDNFRPASPEELQVVHKKYHLPDKFLFYIGSIKRNKNMLRLIKGFSSYVRNNPQDKELALVIGGFKQFDLSVIQEEIRRCGVEDRVHFLGYVDEKELPILYSLATALIYPSTYEGFGLPPLEAMCCHTPVICSYATSLPEVVGDAALLVNPFDPNDIGEKIASLVRDENLQEELIMRGIDNQKRFSWTKCARETLEIYKKVAAH